MQRSISTHKGLWRFLEEMVKHVIRPTELMVEQIDQGNNPREPTRKARLARAEKQNEYEAKLTNREWTPTRFLEASAHLYSKMPMPTQEEVDDYEFRLRVEALENGEEVPEEEEAVEEDGDDVAAPAPEDFNVGNRCKVCLNAEARVVTMPCRHMVMCASCSELIRDNRCPVCRADIVDSFTIFT